MRTKQVIQQEIDALQKELESAPEDFAHAPDGLYIATYTGDSCLRFILKANGTAVSFTDLGSLAGDCFDSIKEHVDKGYYQDLKLLQTITHSAPTKIDVNWKLIDQPIISTDKFKELQKVAKWARPLLEGK